MDVLVCARRLALRALPMAFVMLVFGNYLSASTVVVGTCKSLVQFTTIQAAIHGVLQDLGTTDTISPNTYSAVELKTGSSCTPTPQHAAAVSTLQPSSSRIKHRPVRP